MGSSKTGVSPEGTGIGDGDANCDEGPTAGGREVAAAMGEPLTTAVMSGEKRPCSLDTSDTVVEDGERTDLSLVELTTVQYAVIAACVCVCVQVI